MAPLLAAYNLSRFYFYLSLYFYKYYYCSVSIIIFSLLLDRPTHFVCRAYFKSATHDNFCSYKM